MELLSINIETIKLFNIVRYQIGENGAPKMESISNVLDIYEIGENKRMFFENIMICFSTVFKIENENENEKKDKKEDND